MNVTEGQRKALFDYVMTNTPVHVFSRAQKEYSPRVLYYWLRNDLMREFKDIFRGSKLWFSVIMTEIFKPYAIDDIAALDRDRRIAELHRKHKLYVRFHPKRHELIAEHNALVDVHNKEVEPLSRLVKIYRQYKKNQAFGRRLKAAEPNQ